MSEVSEPGPSRRLATAWNLVYSYATVALALVRNLALVPVYLHFISIEMYGAWLATGAVVTQLMVTDFGLMGVITQRTAEAYGKGETRRLGHIIATSLAIAAGLSLVAGGAAAALSPWMPRLMNLHGGQAEVLARCFLLVALANGINLISLASGGVLRGLQRPVGPGTVEVVAELISIGVTLYLLLEGMGLYSLALGLAARGLAAAVGNATGCLWVCYRKLGLRLRWETGVAGALWRDSYLQFLTAIAMRLHVLADPFFVGVILGAEAAAIFTVSVRAHETVRLVWAQLGRAITPSLAHLHGEGDVSRFRQVFWKMMLVLALFSAVGMSGIVAFNEAFVGLWVGPALFAGVTVTVLYAVFNLVDTLRVAPYDSLYSLGEFKLICRGMWLTTLVRLPLLLVLLPLGLWAAPSTAMLGAALQAVVFGRYLHRFLHFERGELWGMARRLAWILVPPMLLGAAMIPLVDLWANWALFIVASAGFVGIVIVIVGWLDRDLTRELLGEARSTLRMVRSR